MAANAKGNRYVTVSESRSELLTTDTQRDGTRPALKPVPAPLSEELWAYPASGDSAAIQSSFTLLQQTFLHRRAWAIREQLRIPIVIWIVRTYHRHRRQATLGRLTSIEYQTIMNAAIAPAA